MATPEVGERQQVEVQGELGLLDLARQTSPGVLAADDEVAERLKRKAAISKHLGGLGEAGGRGHADE